MRYIFICENEVKKQKCPHHRKDIVYFPVYNWHQINCDEWFYTCFHFQHIVEAIMSFGNTMGSETFDFNILHLVSKPYCDPVSEITKQYVSEISGKLPGMWISAHRLQITALFTICQICLPDLRFCRLLSILRNLWHCIFSASPVLMLYT